MYICRKNIQVRPFNKPELQYEYIFLAFKYIE